MLDEHKIKIPADASLGAYRVWAGVYGRESGERLELGGQGQALVNIGTLMVRSSLAASQHVQ